MAPVTTSVAPVTTSVAPVTTSVALVTIGIFEPHGMLQVRSKTPGVQPMWTEVDCRGSVLGGSGLA